MSDALSTIARSGLAFSNDEKSDRSVKQTVAELYSEAAAESREGPIYGSCCEPERSLSAEETRRKASSIGYSAEDVRKAPIEAVALSMGCGNPTKYAHFRPGETVLDIGCGAGLDTILSSKAVGRSGSVVAADLTRKMLQLCRQNCRQENLTNLEFVMCDGENLPFVEESFHHVISNCSINLMPNKQKVLKEIHEVVKEQGRVTLSDLLSKVPLPEEFKRDVGLWAACIGGVVTEDSFVRGLGEAGFSSVKVLDRRVFHYGENDKQRIRRFFSGRSGLSSSILDLEGRVETAIVQGQKR